jgi:protein-tyrosine phosphatase
LKKNNIKYIINVSCEISNYYPNELQYYRISIRDNNSESIKTYFQNSRKIIDNFLKLNDGNILVHCYMGASRSATIVADFISYKTKKDITEVLKTMTEKRPIINLTEKFTRDLIDDNLLSNY